MILNLIFVPGGTVDKKTDGAKSESSKKGQDELEQELSDGKTWVFVTLVALDMFGWDYISLIAASPFLLHNKPNQARLVSFG